ncbi:MAG: nickel-responsive transcriptional regulator NikR [Sedimentisphaerales bacterium]|nr:nickel-responsive transcriptional regulator NikR [Sedimentisphaerales bacterium]
MTNIERIGVSLEKKLLAEFDKSIAGKGYKNRSEAIRDLIRSNLSQAKLEYKRTPAIGALFLIYDHHTAHISNVFKKLRHDKPVRTVSSVHVYIDSHNCLEIMILRGMASDINKVGEKIISLKGVKHGYVNIVATGDKPEH